VFGTPSDDRIDAVVSDASGNLFIAGYRGGILGVQDYWPAGDSIGFLRKIDASGLLVWERVFGTAGTDLVDALALTASGKIIVAGRTTGAFPGWTNGGQVDLFVAELSGEGDLVGFGQFGDEKPQHPVAIAVQADAAFVVAGYDDIYVVGNAVHDWTDGFLASFAVDGTGAIHDTGWTQENSIIGDEVTGVAKAPDNTGDLFVARNRNTQPAQGGGISVDRVSPDGVVVWHASISTLSMDFIAGIVVSQSGRLYVAGTTFANLYGPSLGNSDGFVAALDPVTGLNVWGRQIGSPQADWISNMTIDADGNLVLAGSSPGTIQPGHVSSGDDPFVLMLTPEGQALGAWQGQPGAPNDGTYAAAAMPCANVIAFAGSLSGISPPANLGRTDAEVTLVRIERFDRIMANDFEIE
jgi:hypothetical protein